MAEPLDSRVAVYLDFDNIVISRYDQVNGRGLFMRDRARGVGKAERAADAEVEERFTRATVDVGAIIDFASSFGTLVLTRAYADWSAPVNADYRGQLVGRAVDLVQLFPAAAYAKNGADIRLAVDAVEDMFRLPDLTHVVLVAGDSDYIALAQRCKRLGRYVIGIGVAGSTSKALAAACDEFVTYDALPGVVPAEPASPGRVSDKAKRETATDAASAASDGDGADTGPVAADPAATGGSGAASGRKRGRRQAKPVDEVEEAELEPEPEADDPQDVATRLLQRALRIGHEKDDAEWLHASAVKTQMKRMDPSFNEKSLGARSFLDFLESRWELVDLDESGTARLVRLKPELPGRR